MPKPDPKPEIADRLKDFLVRKLTLTRPVAALETDDNWLLVSWHGDPGHFGLEPQAGVDLRDQLPALVGAEPESLELNQLQQAEGAPFDLHVLPRQGGLQVVLMDASEALVREQALQQKANENAILNYRLKQLMAEIDQARQDAEKASALKSAFIAGMSHEFRTPLTAILGLCEILQRHPEQHPERIPAVRRSANHLLSLVENLLDHGRVEADTIAIEPVATDLPALFSAIEGMFRPLADGKGLKLTFRCEQAPVGEVTTDPVRLRQILVNLLGNAIRYTREGEVSLRWRHEMGALAVAVADTGPGIPTSEQEAIFRPFSQLEGDRGKGGLGLGLSICRRLAEALHGGLVLHSKAGEGATFVLDLPMPDCEHGGGQVLLSAPRILVVDDDPDIREVLEIVLSDMGAEVLLAASSAEAKALFDASRPQLALVDVNLGESSTGLDLVETFLNDDESLRVVGMSASNAEAVRRAARAAGCAGFVVKPFDFMELEYELRIGH